LQPADVVLSENLAANRVTALAESSPVAVKLLGGATVAPGSTLVAFGDDSLFVLQPSPLKISVFVGGVLDTVINSRWGQVLLFLCCCCPAAAAAVASVVSPRAPMCSLHVWTGAIAVCHAS
jgi:hypothetical protein